ncbi:MAG: exodeoxyribonuclease III [Rickettsiales bacterium]|jgi:exodeoxyribonuclease-3|nr:exodeoxyribonuclease III [Rickettsiales bacterium]
MKIVTWNVNSIRSRIPHLMNFIKNENPDVVLLQELKCTNDQFPFFEFETMGYNIEVFGQKGSNGVAIFSKFRLEEIKKEYFESNENEARYIEGCFCYKDEYYKVASIYVPNGGAKVNDDIMLPITKTDTFCKKMKFCDLLKTKFLNSINSGEIAFYGGDYNVCPSLNIDVYSVKKDGEITNTGEERQKFKELLDIGMCDVWRQLNPALKEYSWWGYRPSTMFEKNQGYRLDAILTSLKTQERVKNAYICKWLRAEEKPSDHVALVMEV